MAERRERGFVSGFSQARVNVDRPGNVFEQCAHLKRQCKLTRQFSDMRADRVKAKHNMIGLARCDANETTIRACIH